MANSKISALTSAATVVGTEVLPIVQSSATVKVSVANLTPGLNTITAVKGGTGQTSYAVGDLLYADTTTTLAKLADVATGNALISGGVSTAPSWGKIGLTTHVSGTLPVANGGTATTTAFTAGSVVFAGASGVYSQNNASFFWDNTNTRLGVGTATPTQKISIFGANFVSSSFNGLGIGEAGAERLRIGYKDGTPDTGLVPAQIIESTVQLQLASRDISTGAITFSTGTGIPERMRVFGSGGVSIGDTTDPSAGNLRMGTGNVVQGTAAKGFNFTANTPAAGMTSQLLNWYEEGTWTPNQGAGLTLVGAFSSTGRYTRIGRQVSISGTVTGATSVAVTAAGVITSNLPFTVVTAGHGDATNVAVNASATVICTSTNVTSAAAIAATGTITFSATYFV